MSPEDVARCIDRLRKARAEVARVILGQDEVITQVFAALLSSGHVLIESAPGLGKTLLVRTVGQVCGLDMSRIQFTPDLMPADITGALSLVRDDQGDLLPRFQPGPVFAQLVLADEINRATPKTQSALLEAMQEGTVTIAGIRHELPSPFLVFATQNPIEMDGTYALPEAQIDRFALKVQLTFPTLDVLNRILEMPLQEASRAEQVLDAQEVLNYQFLARQVPVSSRIRMAVAQFVRSTHPGLVGDARGLSKYVRFGVSPRGAQALMIASQSHALLQGRVSVSSQDLQAVASPTLRHRVHLTYEALSEGVSVDEVIIGLMREFIKDLG